MYVESHNITFSKKAKKMEKFCDDCENWMTLLPHEVKDLPIIYLSIPGTHNSMTYGINSRSEISLDAPDFVRAVYKYVPGIVRRWAKTQGLDTMQQLNSGIRYLDLRISMKEGSFYFAHGLYCFEIQQSLPTIKEFLDNHPNEFVILDFQHFYGLTEEDHNRLQNYLLNLFGTKIYGKDDGSIADCTLNRAAEFEKQILVIYRYYNPIYKFWPSQYWSTPWPNTDNLNQLEKFLEGSLSERVPGRGNVSQCLITPSGPYIARWLLSSLYFSAKRTLKSLKNWISEQYPGPVNPGGPPKANVFIADFVEINDKEFCKTVIGLNGSLQY